MSKRKTQGQMNTLFNYFKSPKNGGADSPRANRSIVQNKESDDDEPVVQRKRIRLIDSDSDSDTENNVPVSNTPKRNGTDVSTPKRDVTNTPKRTKVMEVNTTAQIEKSGSLEKFTFGTSASTSRKIDVDNEEPKKSQQTEIVPRWLHEKLDFLKPEKIRDANKNKPNHPDYDPKTLYVPLEYLNSLTPAMRQWWVLKSQHFNCVLFFKVGKFYELYHMDASVGVDHLGFSYMKGEFAHSGFPETAYAKMASSLIEQGFKVARIEQTETPEMMKERCMKLKKKTKFDTVVNREICQISAKGACIYGAQLTEALSPTATYMIAIIEKPNCDKPKRFGVCFIDTSRRYITLSEFDDDVHCSRLLALLVQHPPALVLTERNRLTKKTSGLLKNFIGNARHEVLAPGTQFYEATKVIQILQAESYFKDDQDEVKLPEVFINTLLVDGFPNSKFEFTLKAFGGCIWYLKDAEMDIQVIPFAKVEIYNPLDALIKQNVKERAYMVLDFITLNNLKLLGDVGTLQNTIDYCVTPFGKRLLQQWICKPLCNVQRIKERQQAVKELVENEDLLKTTRDLCLKLPDLERQLSKIHTFGNKCYSTDHPDSRAVFYEQTVYTKRKILDLISTLEAFERTLVIPKIFKDCKSSMLNSLTQHPPKGKFFDLSNSIEFFQSAFDHNNAKANGTIIPQQGVDIEYDVAQRNIREVQEELDEYLEDQRKFFKCSVSYFGSDKKRFQIEVPENKAHLITKGSPYRLEGMKKGSKPARRYSTSRSKELLSLMMKAEEERNKILQDLNRRIFKKFSEKYEEWEQVIHCLMVLDCICSFAEYARLNDSACLPTVLPFADNPICNIVDGKHPCITNINNFVPNDSNFGGDQPNILLLTGPNMGGKSTLMRQVVLINIMAQLGCYVPATKCELTLVDRIFTRLGAYDDIISGQSTAYIEFSEASAILKHATRNSFVLLDELGRGTSTHDGNAIATGFLRKLCEINCRTIFSTHYHTLVDFFRSNNEIQLGHMDCMVENESDMEKQTVTFLYKLVPGSCPKSFGFNVACLAGVVPTITKNAIPFSANLETTVNNRRELLKLLSRLRI